MTLVEIANELTRLFSKSPSEATITGPRFMELSKQYVQERFDKPSYWHDEKDWQRRTFVAVDSEVAITVDASSPLEMFVTDFVVDRSLPPVNLTEQSKKAFKNNLFRFTSYRKAKFDQAVVLHLMGRNLLDFNQGKVNVTF